VDLFSYVSGGDCVLAVANGSKFVLMYGVASKSLLKRFVLSENVSIEGVLEFQNTNLLTDFGPMVEVAPKRETFLARQQALPGVSEIVSRDIIVNPSGDEFCALSSEGVHVFRRDFQLVKRKEKKKKKKRKKPVVFILLKTKKVLDAPGLSFHDTPASVRDALVTEHNPTRALAVALGLDSSVVPLLLPLVNTQHVALVAAAMPIAYVARLLSVISEQINLDKPDLHLYLLWIRHLLAAHFRIMQAEFPRTFRQPVLAVQRAIFRKMKSISEAAEANKAMLAFLVASPAPALPEEDEQLVLDGPMELEPLVVEENVEFVEDRVGKRKKRKKSKKQQE
jgi:periodic tryptophan protein 2